MQDLIGRTLGHYRIVDRIGAGGMGEVYRAHDERLGRDVAIKTILESVAQDEQRMARFEREAKLLASLSHQNIATLHGLEEHDGRHFLVMELAEGETLASKIASGPIPIDDALDYARQIAEGLEAAHKRGIIHRDLKPANIMLSDEGRIKILDFGLAKGFESPGSSPSTSESIANSPTLTAAVTGTGVLLGTAAYMSPEQARGKQADKRADVWAFGCVLYEMLTGNKAFEGDDASQTMAAILRDEPDLAALPLSTPNTIRRLITRCLTKKPRDRFHDIADARIILQSIRNGDFSVNEEFSPAVVPRSWRRAVVCGVGALVPAAVVAVLFGMFWPTPERPVTRSLIELEPGNTLGTTEDWTERDSQTALGRTAFAVSPDGDFLVYSAGNETSSQLYIRRMDSFGSSPIEGTRGAWAPFISPDGGWIGFWANGELKRVRISGGSVETVCSIDVRPAGASWGHDGTIFFGQPVSGIFRVPEDGGIAEQATVLKEGESKHQHPQLLPDGETLIFTARPEHFRDWNNTTIVAQSLRTGERSIVATGASDAHYSPTGHLVFMRQGNLMATPFDLKKRTSAGPEVVVHGNVRHAINTTSNTTNTFSGQYSLAENGSLVHLPGGMWPDVECQPVWVDRKGTEEPLKIPPATYFGLQISPNGDRVALRRRSASQEKIWIYEVSRGTLSRLTTGSHGREDDPIWTPDGDRITFVTTTEKGVTIQWAASDGSGEIEELSSFHGIPASWSPDGRVLAVIRTADLWDWGIWMIPKGGGEPQPLIELPSHQRFPSFSPNGEWLAYESDHSGRREVYVTPFPGPGPHIQVSADGGFGPAWSPEGNELFYRAEINVDGLRSMMAVDIVTEPAFSAGPAKVLFSGKYFMGSPVRTYDIAPDGERFLMCKIVDQSLAPATHLNLTINWFEELNRLAPPD